MFAVSARSFFPVKRGAQRPRRAAAPPKMAYAYAVGFTSTVPVADPVVAALAAADPVVAAAVRSTQGWRVQLPDGYPVSARAEKQQYYRVSMSLPPRVNIFILLF